MLAFSKLGKAYFGLLITSDFRMPKVPTGHEDATRGSTNRCTRIMLRESHTVASELVDMWSRDFVLAVTTEFPVAQIIRQNKDDIARWGRR
jgi:hypothetical protein